MEFTLLMRPFSLWQRLRRSRAWRIPATGLGFAIFGLCGCVLSLSLFPLIYLLPIRKRQKEALSRKSIAGTFRIYLRLLRWLGLLSYELHDIAKLREPNQLIIANHPSLLDVVFIIALTGDTNCIVKGSLWRNPFTSIAIRAANYISNADENLFQRCVATLEQGQSLIVFPEGTRTRPGEMLNFHRGPSNISLSAGKAITPIIINCHPATLLKNQQWYEVSATPPHYTIQVMPTFNVAHYLSNGQLQSLAARQLTRDLVSYFSQHITG